MATETFTKVLDDLTGEEGAEPYSLTINGVEYTIDLAAKSAEKLNKALAPFLAKATKVGGRRRPASTRSGRKDLAAVREWAKKQKLEVSERGRVSKAVLEAYDAAH